MKVLDQLKDNIVYYKDARFGTFRDLRGDFNTYTSAINIIGHNFKFDGSGILDENKGLDLSSGSGFTVLFMGDISRNTVNNAGIISDLNGFSGFSPIKVGNSNPQQLQGLFNGNGSLANIVANAIVESGFHTYGITASFANSAQFFKDGLTFGSAASIAASTAADFVTVGDLNMGQYSGSSSIRLNNSNIVYGIVFNIELTKKQVADITNELMCLEPDQRPWDQYEAFYPSLANNVLADGDMELSGVSSWISGLGAILTKEPSNLYGGSQCIRITDNSTSSTCYQNNVLTTGKTYRVRGWFRGDGDTGFAGVLIGTTLVATSTTSNEWQWFDATATANNVFFQLRKEDSFSGQPIEYVEFDHILVEECGTTAFQIPFKGEMGAIANETNFTSGQLENVPFEVVSGSVQIKTETLNSKLVKCFFTSAGNIIKRRFSKFLYCQYHLTYYLGGLGVSYIVPSSRDDIINSSGQIGIRIASDGSFGLRVSGTQVASASAGSIPINQYCDIDWYIDLERIRILINGIEKINYAYSTAIIGDRSLIQMGINDKVIYASEDPARSLYWKVD